VLTQAEVDAEVARFEAFLDAEFEAGKTFEAEKADWMDGQWQGIGLPRTTSAAARPPSRPKS
jgi:2-oxoglutarate dehydrogenase E1 component